MDTCQLTRPSNKFQATLPSYVTKITLTISGEGMEPMVLDVPLDTMVVDFIVTPGERVFTVLVDTNISGLSFTGSWTRNLPPGGGGNLDFSLAINAPPQDVALSASTSSTVKNSQVTISLTFNELDPDDVPTVSWTSSGGTLARTASSPNALSQTHTKVWSSPDKGTFSVCATVDDHNGGAEMKCVTITVENRAPVITSVTFSNTSPLVGDVITATCTATDEDGDAITYSWADGNGWSGTGQSVSYTVTQAGLASLVCTASDGDGGVATSSIGFTSAPLSPTGLAVTAGNAQNILSWALVSGASSYNIYWDTQSGVTTARHAGVMRAGTKISTSSSPYTHGSLTNGAAIYYVMTSVSNGVESSPTAEVSATPADPAPGTPTGVSATASDGQVQISWSAVTGATSYNIYWKQGTGVTTGDTQIGSATSPYTHTGLTNGLQYSYRVTAVSAGGESALSTEVSGTPQVAVPGAPTINVTPGDQQNSVSWGAVTGATSYNIYWKQGAGVTLGDTQIGSATSPYTHTGLTNGSQYSYRVTAVSAGGEGSLSTEVSGTPQVAVPGAPTINVTPGDAQNSITWSAVAGATSYNIYWKQGTGVTTGDTQIGSAASPYTHPGLTNGSQYSYRVTAVSAGGESALSAEVSGTPFIASPTNLAAGAGNAQNILTWSAVSGAGGYRIYWNTTGTGVTTGDTAANPGNVTTYNHTTLTNWTTYYYRIATLDSGGNPGPITTVDVSATPAASPASPSATAGNAQVTVSWSAVTGATSYNIYWGLSTGVTVTNGTKINVTTLTHTHTVLTNGTPYYYIVTAVNGANESPASTEVTATPSVSAGTIVVNTTVDELNANGNCSLREAIQSANTNTAVDACASGSAGADTITLPGGTYIITIAGTAEDNNATGDFDIRENLTINGAGAGSTIIDGGALDRVIHVAYTTNTIFSIDGVTVRNGSVTGLGGGIYANADGLTTSITNSIISGNTSTNGNGGAIYTTNGAATVVDSTTISGNIATLRGGGIYSATTSVTITNSTVSGNSAADYGGGIASSQGVAATNCTISGNSASVTGGVYTGNGRTNLKNTIVANQTLGGDCITVANISANNMDSDGTCGVAITGSPLLNVLANNGGPTQTHSLQAGSPAIDAGDNATCVAAPVNGVDQRGNARNDGACDIGAYENP